MGHRKVAVILDLKPEKQVHLPGFVAILAHLSIQTPQIRGDLCFAMSGSGAEFTEMTGKVIKDAAALG